MKNQEDVENYRKQLFKSTIELLESIPDLRDKLEQDQADIADLKSEISSKSSLHQIKGLEGPRLDDDIRQLQKIRNRERAQKRTENLLIRIEKALDKMRKEDGYEILEMRYLKGMTMEQISEELNYSTKTIFRKHKRLIQKLEIKLFGADALEVQKEN